MAIVYTILRYSNLGFPSAREFGSHVIFAVRLTSYEAGLRKAWLVFPRKLVILPSDVSGMACFPTGLAVNAYQQLETGLTW